MAAAATTLTLPFNPGSSKITGIFSGTSTASENSPKIVGVDKFSGVNLHVNLATVTGTSPTWNILLQQLAADGTTWYDIGAMAQITAAGDYILSQTSGGNANFTVVTAGTLAAGTQLTVLFGGTHRVAVVVGGTNPSGTLTVDAEYIE